MSMPPAVAIPLPPRKPAKTVQMCPRMAEHPAMICTTVKSSNGVALANGIGPYMSRATTIVATSPFAMSMRMTKTPAFQPKHADTHSSRRHCRSRTGGCRSPCAPSGHDDARRDRSDEVAENGDDADGNHVTRTLV